MLLAGGCQRRPKTDPLATDEGGPLSWCGQSVAAAGGRPMDADRHQFGRACTGDLSGLGGRRAESVARGGTSSPGPAPRSNRWTGSGVRRRCRARTVPVPQHRQSGLRRAGVLHRLAWCLTTTVRGRRRTARSPESQPLSIGHRRRGRVAPLGNGTGRRQPPRRTKPPSARSTGRDCAFLYADYPRGFETTPRPEDRAPPTPPTSRARAHCPRCGSRHWCG